jgi:ketosteroid isomerase-like protein
MPEECPEGVDGEGAVREDVRRRVQRRVGKRAPLARGGVVMNEVRIHPTSFERFIGRLHEAFLDGDDAPAGKVVEARNVQRLQEQYRAIARGDFTPVLAGMADGIELELHGPADLPLNGCWRGRAEVGEAMQRNFASLSEQQAEILAVVAQGDSVVLFSQERGKVRATGAPYHLRWVQLFTFQDDKVVRVRGVAAHLPSAGG